jgi:N-acyl-L-homoserine lactone synthetase
MSNVGSEFSFGAYRFARNVTDAVRQSALELRQRVYVEEGYIEPPSQSGEVFADEFDDTAAHLVAYGGDGEVVGTTRFVLPSPIGYPTERLFNVARPEVGRETLGEFSRLAIAKEHRGGRREPMIGLLKLVYDVMVANHVTAVYAFLAPKLITSYAALGCVSRVIDTAPLTQEIQERRTPMRGYFAREKVVPVLFRLDEMIPAITAP